MIVFRCTQRLAKRFRLRLAGQPPMSNGLLGDWYANLLNVGHSRLVLCLSERALLPVLLPARQKEFPSRFPEHLVAVLQHLGIPRVAIESEAEAAREVIFAPTQSRQVIGSLNDFAYHAGVYLERGQSTLEASLMLAEMPSKAIHYESARGVAQSIFAASGHA